MIILKEKIDKGQLVYKNRKEWQDVVEMKKIITKADMLQEHIIIFDMFNYSYRWIFYIWYANEYLIGFKGSKKIAKIIKKKSENFLKFNFHFKNKGEKLVYGKDGKVVFLGFNIQILSKQHWVISETKKMLSFKKIKNKISARKKVFEAWFEKTIMKIYEAKKLKILKILLRNSNKINVRENILDVLAMLDIKELMKVVRFKSIKLFYYKKFLVNHDYKSLLGLWIKENEFRELGYYKIIKIYNSFLEALKKDTSFEIMCKARDKKISKVCLSQSQTFQLQIYAPIYQLNFKLKSWHIVSESGKPKSCNFVIKYEDTRIIEVFKQKAVGLLNYYKPAFNFQEVKKLINYHLRWSLIHTLAAKYSTKVYKIMLKYGKTPKVILVGNCGKKKLVEFITSNEINSRPWGFFVCYDPFYFKARIFEKRIQFKDRIKIINLMR